VRLERLATCDSHIRPCAENGEGREKESRRAGIKRQTINLRPKILSVEPYLFLILYNILHLTLFCRLVYKRGTLRGAYVPRSYRAALALLLFLFVSSAAIAQQLAGPRPIPPPPPAVAQQQVIAYWTTKPAGRASYSSETMPWDRT